MALPRTQDNGSASAPILEMRNIAKRFDATQALDDVSLTLYPGEVHALLGENGAGKSTLIKIITGVYQPDRGEILLAGKPVVIGSAAEAQRLGVAAIYQEPLLFPDLTVAENIFISHQDRGQVVGWRKMVREAEAILAELGVAIDVRSPARGLTLAAQQSVEIAKAISLNVRVLIMDEPTASLSAHEVAQLFKLVRDLRDQGVAILFVSHRIEEVFEIADKVTVFRDGRLISTRPRAEATPQRSIADMVGREMGLFQPRPPQPAGERVLSVRGLAREGVFEDVSFDLHRGEVLGFAGLIGAGRTDVGLVAFRHRAGDRGDDRAERQGGHHPLPARGDGFRHRLCFRGPPAAWPLPADVDLGQHHAAGAEALSQPLRPCPDRDGARDGRDVSQAPGDPDVFGRPCPSPSFPAATSRR